MSKTLFIIALFLILILCMGVIGYVFFDYGKYPRSAEDKAFYQKFVKAASESNPIAMHSLTDFSWDKFCVHGPYTSNPPIPWRDNDGYWTIIFYANNAEKLKVRIHRKHADHEGEGCFSGNATATFRKETSTYRGKNESRIYVTFTVGAEK